MNSNLHTKKKFRNLLMLLRLKDDPNLPPFTGEVSTLGPVEFDHVYTRWIDETEVLRTFNSTRSLGEKLNMPKVRRNSKLRKSNPEIDKKLLQGKIESDQQSIKLHRTQRDRKFRLIHYATQQALLFYTNRDHHKFILAVNANSQVMADIMFSLKRGPIFYPGMTEAVVYNALAASSECFHREKCKVALLAVAHFLANEGTVVHKNFGFLSRPTWQPDHGRHLREAIAGKMEFHDFSESSVFKLISGVIRTFYIQGRRGSYNEEEHVVSRAALAYAIILQAMLWCAKQLVHDGKQHAKRVSRSLGIIFGAFAWALRASPPYAEVEYIVDSASDKIYKALEKKTVGKKKNSPTQDLERVLRDNFVQHVLQPAYNGKRVPGIIEDENLLGDARKIRKRQLGVQFRRDYVKYISFLNDVEHAPMTAF